MQIIYKKTILDKIQEATHEAKLLNKTIDKIVVSQEEWDEIVEWGRTIGCTHAEASERMEQDSVNFCGVKVEKEAVREPQSILMVYDSIVRAKTQFDYYSVGAAYVYPEDMSFSTSGVEHKFVSINCWSDLDKIRGKRYNDIVFSYGSHFSPEIVKAIESRNRK